MPDQSSTPSEKQTFTGGCICGKVKYKISLSTSPPPRFYKCNCTPCQKRGVNVLRAPREEFEMIAPCNNEQLFNSKHGEYVGNYIRKDTSPHLSRFFCDECGSPFAINGYYMHGDKKIDYFSVDPKTLDQPQEGLELSTFVGEYIDGLHNAYAETRTDRPYPGGIV
ncbi:hypothetical protein K461DRAFT_264511 [Myriangium duriaei CBS 260.36]|uniref:CENP-V/GFA domain-containing protein n=1 Tax=Myriangium duriaei CBS 260.36 TaxID=1168546 RepID=A0A9P4MLT6_9PEZI|nr:hypothetical protein K461DRAFT_264511 [Myriangium duriaei CBS 260.36]